MTYYVSGQTSDANRITHILIHEALNNGANVGPGHKITEAAAMVLIAKGHILKTIIWDYTSEAWYIGATIHVVPINGSNYLRTNGDSTVADNLDNLLPLHVLGI